MTLATRSMATEKMDTDCADYDDYRRCLRDLSRVNTITLTHRPTLAWLKRRTQGKQSFSLLDVACGYGDALRAVRRWADRSRFASARDSLLDGCLSRVSACGLKLEGSFRLRFN